MKLPINLVLFACLGMAGAQTLRQLADSRGIHLGAAVKNGTRDATYDTTVVHQFNTIVCENYMKWDATEGTRNKFTFTNADGIANLAYKNALSLRGHNFVWHSQIPGWVSSITNRDTLLKVMKNHIDSLAGHYKGKIYEWDVVNEAVADGGTSLRTSFWFQRIGADFIDSAFVYAHRADPNALLVYNDYGAEGMTGSTATKSTGVYNLVSGLKSRGIPINGVGLQSHFSLNGFDTASIGANMSRIEALGLNISITELDITTSNTTANLNTQKANYKALMTLCLSHPRCKTFITWGVNDAQSWRGANSVALLFTNTATNGEYATKPAADGIQEAISGVTGIWQVATGKSGVLRPAGMNNGSALFNVAGKAFDLSGRKLSILPLSK